MRELHVVAKNEEDRFEKHGLLEFSKRNIAIALLVITALLLIAHIVVFVLKNSLSATAWEPLDGLFNLSRESNFPTFFSAFLLLASGLLAALIYQYKRKTSERFKNQWLILSFVFIFLSVDEAVQIHERLTTISGKLFKFLNASFLSFAWVIPYTLLFLLVAFYFLKFIMALPKKTRNLLLVAGVLFIGGALGFEFIEGYVYNQYGFNNLYWLLATIEEIMEITGVILTIYALLDYIQAFNIKFGIRN